MKRLAAGLFSLFLAALLAGCGTVTMGDPLMHMDGRLLTAPTSGEILLNQGLAAKAEGDYGNAFRHWERALVIFAAERNEAGAARAHARFGQAYFELNRYDSALQSFQEASRLFAGTDLPEERLAALIGMASVYERLGDHAKALDQLHGALKITAAAGYRELQPDILSGMGAVSLRNKDYAGALQAYEKAFTSAEDNLRGKETKTTAGNFLLYGGSFEKDIGQAKAARTAHKKRMQAALSGMGLAHREMGKHREALGLFEKSLDLARQRNDAGAIIDALNETGACHLALESPHQARLLFEEGLGLAAAMGLEFPEKALYAHYGIGIACERQGDISGALASYRKAIGMIEELRGRLAAAEHRSGYLENKIAVYEGMIDLLVKQETVEPALQPYGKTNREIAFFYAESTRTRSLIEAMARARQGVLSARLPKELAERENRLLQQLVQLQSAQETGLSREEQIGRARNELENLIAEIRRLHPDYAAIRYPEPARIKDIPLRAGEVLLAYKVNAAATYLWVIRKGQEVRFISIPVGREDLAQRVLEFQAPLADPARRHEFDPKKGESLHRLLLAEAIAGVDGSENIIIVPDGVLNLLPFEALTADAARAVRKPAPSPGIPFFEGIRYLGDDYRISYYPSASVMALVRKAKVAAAAPQTLFALGDPVYDEADPRWRADLSKGPPAAPSAAPAGVMLRDVAAKSGFPISRLPETRDEVLEIGGLFGLEEGSPHIRLDAAASKKEIRDADLLRYRYIHLATHGILSGDIPYIQEPALVLAQVGIAAPEEGYLKMSEVLDLRLHSEMVVLSACKTALGKEVAGEGVVGLSRAFMLAGAKSVVVSLWSVESRSTADLMKRYYGLLKAGKTKEEALRLAKREFREADYAPGPTRGVQVVPRGEGGESPAAHPFFWAPFILIGEWD
jgi:CHAT domain-containing protein